ncbi:MAG: PEP-CTERM sorting domain-containing protein [Natronospirillum sp.]
MKLIISIPLALGASFLTAASAMAAPVLMEHTLQGNDCAGVFGMPFASCEIAYGGVSISPVIAKYDLDDEDENDFTALNNSVEINSALYPSFDGSEISTDLNAQTWSYNQGENDPGIRFWVAKGGNYFNLFWYVDSGNQGDCAGNAYNLACLQQALVVAEGSWTTPINPNNQKPFGLSHLTFYNSGTPPALVPEPGSAALLFSGIMGLFMARRRRHHLSA